MGNRKYLLVIIPFFAILYGVLFVALISPYNAHSYTENRLLMEPPTLSRENYSEFPGNAATYVTEQFPGREGILKLYSMLLRIQNSALARNVYVTDDQWLLPISYRVDDFALNEFCRMMEKASGEVSRPVDFYYAMLPMKTNLLYTLAPEIVDESGARENRVRILDALSNADSVRVIDVSGYMAENYDEDALKEMFYRYDFHWNAYGAYAAADYIQRDMARNGTIQERLLFSEENFDFETISDKTFAGDLGRRFSGLFDDWEVMPLITPKDTDKLEYYLSAFREKPVSRAEIVGTGLQNASVSYSDMYTHNLGYYRIFNPGAPVEKSLLVFKDSLFNPMPELFSEIFIEVQVVDLRYYEEDYSFYGLISAKDVDVVLYAFHQNNASAELTEFLGQY